MRIWHTKWTVNMYNLSFYINSRVTIWQKTLISPSPILILNFNSLFTTSPMSMEICTVCGKMKKRIAVIRTISFCNHFRFWFVYLEIREFTLDYPSCWNLDNTILRVGRVSIQWTMTHIVIKACHQDIWPVLGQNLVLPTSYFYSLTAV